MTLAEIIKQAMCCRKSCINEANCYARVFELNAQAAIAALDKEGFVIVPRTPTEKMLVAGIKVCSHAAITNAPQTAVIYGQPKDIYQAMIEAAP